MKRIMVIGSAGSGKSTAARLIGGALGLPVYHMDREVFWLPGWKERPKVDQIEQVKRIVACEEWVFEGNNSSTFHLRERRAEMLVWLDVPILLRLWRVTWRNIRLQGQARPDAAGGCSEKLSMLPDFLHFIVTTARASRCKQAKLFHQTALSKHRFTNAAQVNAFVTELVR